MFYSNRCNFIKKKSLLFVLQFPILTESLISTALNVDDYFTAHILRYQIYAHLVPILSERKRHMITNIPYIVPVLMNWWTWLKNGSVVKYFWTNWAKCQSTKHTIVRSNIRNCPGNYIISYYIILYFLYFLFFIVT